MSDKEKKIAGKAEVRAYFKARRHALGAHFRDQAACMIATRLQAENVWKEADTVLSYYSFGDEVGTHLLIEQALAQGKTVLLPRSDFAEGRMRWYRIEDSTRLLPGAKGIEEPVEDPSALIAPASLDPARSLVLVPALCYDCKGYRLGYGAGFFDRFLAEFKGFSVGLCYEACLVPDLKELACRQDHDKKVRSVISETRSFLAERRDGKEGLSCTD